MTTIENLYHGNIHPYDCYTEKGSEAEKTIHLIAESEGKLSETLSEGQKKIFDSFKEEEMKLSLITETEAFKQGFSLGIKLMIEISNT